MNKEWLHLAIKRALHAVLHVYWVFPVRKNRIALINEQGFTYNDSLKYINEYLREKCPGKYEVIYPVKAGTETAPDAVAVKPMSVKYFYYVLTSRVIFTNCGGVSYLPKRRKQKIINTWHGGGAYKKVGIDVWDTKYSRAEDKMNASNTDILFASCGAFTKYEAPAMMFDPKQCIPAGLPRNDIFFKERPEIREKVYRTLGLKEDEKLVLYAPTYRSDTSSFANSKEARLIDVDYEKVTETLSRTLGGSWKFGIRLHPRIGVKEFPGMDVVNCTRYPDMQELLYACSAVITDYSSLMWDFSLTMRPCFIYAPDIDQYEAERGFYVPTSQWPFPIARSNEELVRQMETFSDEEYRERVKKHHAALDSYDTGKACETAVSLIESKQA